jgi:hypothetical protein
MSDQTETTESAADKLSLHILSTSSGSRVSLQAAPILCADGFKVSVQAGRAVYCTPRDGNGPWTQFECGFPSAPVPEWIDWRDGDAPDMENVFGYVPADAIWSVLEQHGGPVNLGGRAAAAGEAV